MGNGSDLIIRLLVDDADLDKVDQSKARFDAWGDGLQAAAVPATIAVAALGAAAVVTGKAASDAQQSAGAVESVFGEYAGLIEDNASVAATAVGLTQAAYSNMAAIIGSQLQNIGVPMGDVAGQTDELISLGADLAATFGGTTADAVAALDLAQPGARAELLAELVREEAARQGLLSERDTVARRLDAETARLNKLAPVAARLEDMQRDFSVAEAVFASAIARSQSSKADIYASYPLVQVLENPSLPDRPTSPNRKLALG